MEGQLSKKQDIVVRLLKDGLSIKRHRAGALHIAADGA